MGILGVIIGILALAAALLGTFMFGAEGVTVAVILAVVAIAVGVLKRVKSKKGGITAIVVAVLAVVLAFAMGNVWSNAFKTLRDKAVEYKPDGLWAQASEEVNHGLMGIVRKLPQDEASMKLLVEEMNELNKLDDAQK